MGEPKTDPVAEMRANRWKDQPEGAEEEYEARCAHWESLTDADIWGPSGRPPLPALPVHMSSEAAYAAEDATPEPTIDPDPWSAL